MRTDDETIAVQPHKLLNDKGYAISFRTVLRCRVSLGWTFRGSSYCQLIRGMNKEKRLLFAQQNIGENFNVIFTDECSIQAESHRRFCCRKRRATKKQAKTQASAESPHMGRNQYSRPNSSVHIRRKAECCALCANSGQNSVAIHQGGVPRGSSLYAR